jgi:serine/threonine-protein kinase
MAEVYVAWRAGPRGFNKRLAIKRILPQLASDAHFVSMFCDEARICAALSHPNIVQVVDFGEHDGELFMAMEYVDGVSCAKLLRAVAARKERFPVGAALFIAHQVLRALRYAHEARDERGRPLGIVHRDVSPGNVLIGRAGEVKLTDFGIVRSSFIDRRTYPGELKGKIGYMSPEQALGSEIDCRSDLFTLGIVLSELLLARPLFPGRSEMEILGRIHHADISVLEKNSSDLPPELVDMLRRVLQKKPADRFQSALEFNDAVRDVAKRSGLPLNDTELVPWLSRLGILSSQSGTRPAVKREEIQAAMESRRKRQPTPKTQPDLRQNRRFMVQVTPGCALGPVGLSELIELGVTGRIKASTPVRETGGKQMPLAEVAGLGAIVSRPTFAFGAALRAARSERVEPLKTAGYLYSLVRARATGLLVFRDGDREKRVYLRAGAPVLVASTEPNELLGARLVAQGHLTRADVDRTLEEALENDALFGVTLIGRELIRPARLLRALHEQLEDRFVELGSWQTGELHFSPKEKPGIETLPAMRGPAELVTRLVRARTLDVEIQMFFERHGDRPIARAPEGPIGPGDLGLSEAEALALGRAPGESSLRNVELELVGLGVAPVDTRRAVFVGLASGVLVMPGVVTSSLV